MPQISKLNLSELTLNPNNPRVISDAQLEKLINSILAFPEMMEYRPVVVKGDDNVALGGNQRGLALQKIAQLPAADIIAKVKEQPGYAKRSKKSKEALEKYWEDFNKAPFLNIVKAENLTAAQIKEFIVKDNLAFGDWDRGKLSDWSTKDLGDWGMPDFEVSEVKNVSADTKQDEEPEVESSGETMCHTGDLYELGNHRLICGDATDVKVFDKLLNGEKADISFTSPPYNLGRSDFSKASRLAMNGGKAYTGYKDNVDDDHYTDLLCISLKNCLLNSDDVLFNVGVISGSKIGVVNMLNNFKRNFLDIIVWEKNASLPFGMPAQKGMLSHRAELIFCFNEKGNRSFTHPQYNPGTAINIIKTENNSRNDLTINHHAAFPVAFAGEVLKMFCERSVIDCFGGTGTTLIAAEQLGKKCFMVELDPYYCDAIIKRWEKLTGGGKENRLAA
jgi:DNA modification methylase